jgi:hypothetical protein
VTVVTGRDRLIGKVLAFDDKTLTLQITGQADPTLLRRGDITTVAVSSGRRSRGKGALIGAGVGAGASMVMGLTGDPEGFVTPAGAAVLSAIVLVPLGALFGQGITPSERWKDVPLDRIRLSVHPVRGRGLGVSLALAF